MNNMKQFVKMELTELAGDRKVWAEEYIRYVEGKDLQEELNRIWTAVHDPRRA